MALYMDISHLQNPIIPYMAAEVCLLTYPDLIPHIYNLLATQQLQTLQDNSA